MRVFNITDASTAALRARGLENQHIRVGTTVIAPGGYADLRGTAKELSELQQLVKVRALVPEELPVDYAAKRGLDVRGNKLPTPVKEGSTFMVTGEKEPMPDLKMEELQLAPVMDEFPRKKGK